MSARAIIRAELLRFGRDPVNGKFLLLVPGAVFLSLWPYAASPLYPMFLCVFAGLEPQFNNILYRTPREFDAMSLLPVDWRVVVAAKNAAAVVTLVGTMIPCTAVLAYFSPLPLAARDLAAGFIHVLSMVFPLLILGNLHSVEHPRRIVGVGPGDIAEAVLMILGVAAASIPFLLAAGTDLPLLWTGLWTLAGALVWWTWSIPRTAARIVNERTTICRAT